MTWPIREVIGLASNMSTNNTVGLCDDVCGFWMISLYLCWSTGRRYSWNFPGSTGTPKQERTGPNCDQGNRKERLCSKTRMSKILSKHKLGVSLRPTELFRQISVGIVRRSSINKQNFFRYMYHLRTRTCKNKSIIKIYCTQFVIELDRPILPVCYGKIPKR